MSGEQIPHEENSSHKSSATLKAVSPIEHGRLTPPMHDPYEQSIDLREGPNSPEPEEQVNTRKGQGVDEGKSSMSEAKDQTVGEAKSMTKTREEEKEEEEGEDLGERMDMLTPPWGQSEEAEGESREDNSEEKGGEEGKGSVDMEVRDPEKEGLRVIKGNDHLMQEGEQGELKQEDPLLERGNHLLERGNQLLERGNQLMEQRNSILPVSSPTPKEAKSTVFSGREEGPKSLENSSDVEVKEEEREEKKSPHDSIFEFLPPITSPTRFSMIPYPNFFPNFLDESDMGDDEEEEEVRRGIVHERKDDATRRIYQGGRKGKEPETMRDLPQKPQSHTLGADQELREAMGLSPFPHSPTYHAPRGSATSSSFSSRMPPSSSIGERKFMGDKEEESRGSRSRVKGMSLYGAHRSNSRFKTPEEKGIQGTGASRRVRRIQLPGAWTPSAQSDASITPSPPLSLYSDSSKVHDPVQGKDIHTLPSKPPIQPSKELPGATRMRQWVERRRRASMVRERQ